MATNSSVAVWDSCVIVHAIQEAHDKWPHKEKRHWPDIEPFLADAEARDFLIVIPESVVAEVTHLKTLDKAGVKIAEQIALIQGFFANPYIVRRPIHRGVSEMAAQIARKYKTKRVGDALVLATAVVWEVPLVHSYDGHLLDLNEEIALEGGKLIEISEPNHTKGTIFDPKLRSDSEPEEETRPEAKNPPA